MVDSLIQFIAAPLMPVMETLIPALAASAHRAPSSGDCTVAAFAVSTGLIGLICVFSTCWIHARLRSLKDRAKQDIAAADVALYFRDALLTGAAEGVVVLRNGEQERQYFGEGKALYEACMESPQASKAIRAIDVLAEQGTPFVLSLPAGEGGLTLRGLPVAGRAVIYLHRESASANLERYREILEALPFPVWIRGASNAIGWANSSFLSTLGFANLEDAITANAALEWSERDLAAKALQSRQPVEGRASVIVNGEARTFSLGLTPVSETAVAGFAMDITQSAHLESRLQLARDAQEEMVQRMPFAGRRVRLQAEARRATTGLMPSCGSFPRRGWIAIPPMATYSSACATSAKYRNSATFRSGNRRISSPSPAPTARKKSSGTCRAARAFAS